MKRIFSQLSWYTGNTIANACIGLLVVPVVIAFAGADQWGAIAVGQSLGSIATILTALGWGYNGPSLIARADAAARSKIAAHSILARAVAFAPIVVPASLIAAILGSTNPAAAALACISVSVAGLGMSWYFIGEGQPKKLFLYDGLPRWMGSAFGVLGLVVSHDIFLLLWFQILGGMASSAFSVLAVLLKGKRASSSEWRLTAAFRGVRAQLYAGITVITATSFAALPTLVVAGLSPSSVPVYALAERLLRLALTAITPFNQWIQGWVPRTVPNESQERRIRWAVKVSFWIAIPLGASVASLSPFAGVILSGGDVQIPPLIAIYLGAAVALSTISRVVGMACLLAVGRDKDVAISALTAAIVGTPLLFFLVNRYSATGAALSLAVSETIVLSIQLYALAKWFRKA